ncbi:hypothetical protein [Cystobacter fuscus]|nr:hypothetical protein [Cystobacter fuscus]
MQRTTTSDSQPQVKKRSNSLTRMMAAMGLGGDKQENKQVAGYSQPPQGYGFAAVPRARPNTNTVTSQPLRPPPQQTPVVPVEPPRARRVSVSAQQAPVVPQASASTSRGGTSRATIRASLPVEIQRLAQQSPTLWSDLKKLEKNGWVVEYGPNVTGNYSDLKAKKIYIRENPSRDPSNADNLKYLRRAETGLLAHEVSHALDELNGPNQPFPHVALVGVSRGQHSKDYITPNTQNALLREADAVINHLRARAEVLDHNGSEIALPGVNGQEYLKIFNEYRAGRKTLDTARQEISTIYAQERPSIGKFATYNEYYSNHYTEHWNQYARSYNASQGYGHGG